MPDATTLRLAPGQRSALKAARFRWCECFGVASRAELETGLVQALHAGHDARGAHELVVELEVRHVERYGEAALRAESVDDCARDRARHDEAGLVRYVGEWTRRIAYRQRAHAARWVVPGLSTDEVRDALSLRLWELLGGDRTAELAYCRAGREWGLEVMLRELRSLRRRFRLTAVSVDFWATALPERTPNQEECWIECEAERCRERAQREARSRLSPVQQQWLSALEAAARAGRFFRSSQALNLSAASRALGKNRSSALRAYRQLEHEFQSELERWE